MKNKKIAIVACIGLALCFLISGAYAFMTAETEELTNVVTYGNIKIELLEPGWDNLEDSDADKIPDIAENLSPGETISKDPTIKNVGKNKTYAFFEIQIPKKSVDYADSNGLPVSADPNNPNDLFSYTLNNSWTLFNVDESNEEYNSYFYHYVSSVEPQATTTPIFNSVEFIDFIEGQFSEENCHIKVVAYGSQIINEEGKEDMVLSWNELAVEENLPIWS